MSKNQNPPSKTSPLHCLIGSFVAGGLAYGIFNLMNAIALSFASKAITTNNEIVFRITIAVRTLVVGMAALGAGIFALVAVGLFGLMIQTLIQKKQPSDNQ
ncbi:DUF3082 domain-containing protein [Brunnivagina elsteri]|uniref:DUF3082 domain-containing protein n=1 Tax=Brunnivagina elsteri CCALA 953 TaxID=987040 RepID=A0A2A2TBL5_9CYAN|nr:DUF3082 domain-containing protein [Calothrix elsteri]PAX51102.1 hypothetical protein CK510_26650 [Calothrix elsteri CCALA 953]